MQADFIFALQRGTLVHMPSTIPVNVRIDADYLNRLEAIGRVYAKDTVLDRSKMLNIAVKKFVDGYTEPSGAEPKPKKPKKSPTA